MDDDAVLNALARLVTDRAAPPPAGRAAEVLAGVDPARVERYVESLLDKRVSELARANVAIVRPRHHPTGGQLEVQDSSS